MARELGATGRTASRKRVGGLVHQGLWLDIGRHEDYEAAVALWARGTRLVEADNEVTSEG